MKEYIIYVVDKDYRTQIGKFYKTFETPEEVKNYCYESSFGGYDYYWEEVDE